MGWPAWAREAIWLPIQSVGIPFLRSVSRNTTRINSRLEMGGSGVLPALSSVWRAALLSSAATPVGPAFSRDVLKKSNTVSALQGMVKSRPVPDVPRVDRQRLVTV